MFGDFKFACAVVFEFLTFLEAADLTSSSFSWAVFLDLGVNGTRLSDIAHSTLV
jgi:hypothetical protein